MAFLRKSRWEQAKADVKKEIFDPIDKDGSGSLDAKEVEYLFSEVGVGAIFSKFADLSKVGGVKEAISAAKKETQYADMSSIEKEMSAILFNNLTFMGHPTPRVPPQVQTILMWCYRLSWLNPLLWPVLVISYCAVHMARWLIPNVDRDGDGKVTFDEILATFFAVLGQDEETFKVFFDANVTDEQYGKVCKITQQKKQECVQKGPRHAI